MSAILVLLGLLSVATLAARRGYAAFVAHMVTAPLLLALGILVAPHNLGFLTNVTLDALEPALHVSVAWLALLVGMRGVRPSLSFLFARDTLVAVGIGLVTWMFLAAVTAGGLVLASELKLGFVEVAKDPRALAGAALLISGLVSSTGLGFAREALQGARPTTITRRVLFLARHDEVIGAFALCAAVALWPLPSSYAPAYANPLVGAGIVVALGAVLGIAQLFSGGARMGGTMASAIALIGLTTFGTGLSLSTHLPGAAIAFFFGGVLALQGRGEAYSRAGFTNSERPVRLVVLVLIGSQLGFSTGAILVGAGVAVARLLAKATVRFAIARSRRAELPLSAILGSAGTALPFALSFALTRQEPLRQSEVLLAVAVSVAVSDLFTLIAWRRAATVGEAESRAVVEAPVT